MSKNKNEKKTNKRKVNLKPQKVKKIIKIRKG